MDGPSHVTWMGFFGTRSSQPPRQDPQDGEIDMYPVLGVQDRHGHLTQLASRVPNRTSRACFCFRSHVLPLLLEVKVDVVHT